MTTPSTPERLPALLTAQEVAEALRVPLSTIYRWRHSGIGPPALRIGRHLRYRREDVHAWIEQQMDRYQ